jgi:hypothetical protein
MSAVKLRTICNHYGISVRGEDGKYITVPEMRTAMDQMGVDTSVINTRSKISAQLAIDYNSWRDMVNENLATPHGRTTSLLTYVVGKSNLNPDQSVANTLRKVGMDTVAKLTVLVSHMFFDEQFRIYGKILNYAGWDVIDPEILRLFPLDTQMMLDFSYFHKRRYGVILHKNAITKRTMVNIHQNVADAINAVTPHTFARLRVSIESSQLDPIWFYFQPSSPKGECFKGSCTEQLRGKGRNNSSTGMSKVHITFNPRFQTFAMYNYITYVTQYPHLFAKAKMFLLSHDSRFNVDDSDIKPSEQYDWSNYLDTYGYAARASIVTYLNVNNVELQVELDTFIDHWTSNGIDSLIAQKSNNILYNKRLSRSILYSISKSTDAQEDIRDTNSPDKGKYSISTQLKKERDTFCKGGIKPATDDNKCITDKWGIDMNDLCGKKSTDGKMHRSDLYFYHGNGQYDPDFYYQSETCTDQRKARDRLPSHIPTHSRK